MVRKRAGVIPVVLLAAMVAGCGGSDNNSDTMDADSSGDSTTGGDNSGGGESGENSGGGDNTSGGDNTAFFNDAAGISFADSLGGRLSSLFGTAFGIFSDDDSNSVLGKRQILEVQSETLSCGGGGSVSYNSDIDNATGAINSISLAFNSCVEDGETTNGSISVSGSALLDDTDGTATINIDNLTVTGADPVAMNGQVSVSTSTAGDQTTATISGPNLTMTADGETVTFSNYSMTVIDNETTGASSLAASLSIQSSVDGTVTVNISPALATPDDSFDYPTSGTLTMTHSDGSSLTIDANTGNPATFNYIINENGATTSGTESWANTELDLS